MAVQASAALPPVRVVNDSSDFLDFVMHDEQHRPLRVTFEPGEEAPVPGEWCVEGPLPNGKRRPSALSMVAPQLRVVEDAKAAPAPKAAKPASPSAKSDKQ